MCTVHDDKSELARLSRLRKSQIKGLLGSPRSHSTTARPCATRVQARARRHRIEAPWLALLLRPLAALGQEQESGGTGGQTRSGGGLRSGTLAIAGRPRNIHRAQGVCSDGNPPQSLVRVLPRPRPTSLFSATHSGGVLVVDEPTQPGAAIRGRLEHSRLRRRYFSAALILHTKGR